ncbi:MAG: zf-TFIIB domain-containing protein [Victivallales bacterium]|nr:zf-TFIIB domain-containing protein [Victivallales bacterium]
MKCPRDGTELKKHQIDGVNVESCKTCSGIFLKKGELNKIAHPLAGDLEYSTLENMDPTRQSELKCPACENINMIDVNFLSFSDIIMKYCSECEGMWLDGGELKAINREIDKLNDDTDNWQHSLRAFTARLPF